MKNLDIKNLEILSPAGNSECFYADINAGADAIYLGLSEFNARIKAENFTTENIRDYVKYAHTFGVKIYVTVNTLLKNDDFEPFLQMIKTLTQAKVDAFIVQDFGVAHLLKTTFKNINLHASTQMGIHNLNGAKIAEKLGFSRIVLSRETSLEDIREIKNNTNLEIEYFVQGALCVAFSGNCYLSSLEKNASGNEGKCLQLCRLPYQNNINNNTAYYLSARDLSLLENLEKLIEAGVTSFKIEGRMRHSGYTATATKIYKQALELITHNKFDNTFIKKAEEELKISYSRGNYNKNAYLENSLDEPVMNSDYQNHIGIKIGTVKKTEPFKNNLTKATLLLSTEIFEGDGLKIIDNKTKTQVASLGVGNVEKIKDNEYIIFTRSKFSSGLDVHLTQSSKNEEKILKNIKKIKINIKIKAFSDNPLEIQASNNNSCISIKTNYILEKATNKPLSENDFISQFEKLSETPFMLESLTLESDGIFLPKSKLNELRRNIASLLENEIINENEKHLTVYFDEEKYNELTNKPVISSPTNIVIFHDKIDTTTKLNNVIYVYQSEIYDIQKIKNLEQTLNPNFALYVPTILKFEDKAYFENILKNLSKTTKLYINNIGAINYNSWGFELIVSPLLNIKNNYALKCLNSLNISTISSSIEADESFILSNNLIAFESGEFPLMTFAHCPYKNISKSTCKNCTYNGKLILSNPNLSNYNIHRTKLNLCQFQMTKKLNRTCKNNFIKNLDY